MRPSPSPRQRTTILLAEDNKINQMLAVKTLEKGGYRLLVANNGSKPSNSRRNRRWT